VIPINFALLRQSLWERFSPRSTSFLNSVLNELLEQRFDSVREPLCNTELKRIIVEDSTHLVMGNGNNDTFPSYGNSVGKNAGVKINLAYDLLSGQSASHTLETARTPDNKIGKALLQHVKEGDLILRDMGYWVKDSFRCIESLNAHWLSRLPVSSTVTSLDGKSLESLLKKTKRNTLDITVNIGARAPLGCRLIAVRVDPKIAQEKRRKRKLKAKKNNQNFCSKSLIRDGWYIMVTSLSADQATVQELGIIYSARWAIELQYRGLKHSLNLKQSLQKATKEHVQKALILTAMIMHQLTLKLWNIFYKVLEKKGRRLSLEKMITNAADYLLELKRLEELSGYDPDHRHLAYDKRNKLSALVDKAFNPLA